MGEQCDDIENSRANYSFRIEREGEITHILATGTATVVSLIGLFSEISHICRKSRSCKILCESKMEGFGSFMDVLTFRASLMTFELPTCLKIALVCSPEYMWIFHTLGNSIYLTAGASADVFGCVDEARAWLLHEPGRGENHSILPLPT